MFVKIILMLQLLQRGTGKYFINFAKQNEKKKKNAPRI